jgi:hypothetical protein
LKHTSQGAAPLRHDDPWAVLQRIRTIKNPTTRAHVASIVWWDHADRHTWGRSCAGPEWRAYIENWRPLRRMNRRAIINGLITAGYPADIAEGRVGENVSHYSVTEARHWDGQTAGRGNDKSICRTSHAIAECPIHLPGATGEQ